MVILVRFPNNPPSLRHYVSGSNNDAAVFSENAADAMLFADAAAATAFAATRNVHGAVQVAVTGLKNHSLKSCT